MAIDLETGEVGNAWELFAKAVKRRHERWGEYSKAGLVRIEAWKFHNPNRRVSPTRFYKIMHGEPQ